MSNPSTDAQLILDQLHDKLTECFNLLIALGKLGLRAAPYSAGQWVKPVSQDGAQIYEAWRPDGQLKRATWDMQIVAIDGTWLQVTAPTPRYPQGLWVRAAEVEPPR